MKVLYMTTVPAPYKVAFFEELGKQCELTVLFENEQVSYREKSWMIKEYTNFKAVFLKGINFRDKKISFQVISFFKNNYFDHIIVGCYSTISQMIAQQYMMHKKIPFIHSSDGGMIKSDSGFQAKLKSHFIGGASAWLSTGKTTSDYLVHYGAEREKIHIYPFTSIYHSDVLDNPDTPEKKQEYRDKLGMHESSVVVSVGQFIRRKGMDVLIKAAPAWKDTGVYIIGGKPGDEYIELKKQYGADNVHFIDFKNKEELSEYYRAADLFVLTTREDIWGLVINEAMAYGLPVVTTDKCVAGLEMVDEGVTGSIIPTDDSESLKKAVVYWLENSGIETSKRVLATAREYTIQNMANIHYDILNKINFGTCEKLQRGEKHG